MITEIINQKIAESLKAKDETKVTTYRLLSSALNYEFIAKQHELTEEEEWVVVNREIKKRKEAIEAYKNVKAEDRARQEEIEMNLLYEFLPKQLSDEEIGKLVDEAVSKIKAQGIADMGKVIGMVVSQAKGKVEGGKVAQIVKEKLTINKSIKQ